MSDRLGGSGIQAREPEAGRSVGSRPSDFCACIDLERMVRQVKHHLHLLANCNRRVDVA